MTRHSGAEDEVRVTNFFGGSDTQITSQNFSGGRVLTVIGGCKLDLRRASIADEGAVINIVASLGGVRLTVPEDWAVNVQTRAVFGGVSTKRVAPASPVGTLTLTGLCLFGGVEVRS